jgi:hypothetical protein
MTGFDELYAKAVEDVTLPGYALLAGDKNGKRILAEALFREALTVIQAIRCFLMLRA